MSGRGQWEKLENAGLVAPGAEEVTGGVGEPGNLNSLADLGGDIGAGLPW